MGWSRTKVSLQLYFIPERPEIISGVVACVLRPQRLQLTDLVLVTPHPAACRLAMCSPVRLYTCGSAACCDRGMDGVMHRRDAARTCGHVKPERQLARCFTHPPSLPHPEPDANWPLSRPYMRNTCSGGRVA